MGKLNALFPFVPLPTPLVTTNWIQLATRFDIWDFVDAKRLVTNREGWLVKDAQQNRVRLKDYTRSCSLYSILLIRSRSNLVCNTSTYPTMSEAEPVVPNSDNPQDGLVDSSEKDQLPSASNEVSNSDGLETASPSENTNENGEKDIAEPPKKKAKKSKPSKQSSKAAEKLPEIIPGDKYPYARRRGIRIFSDREIEVQDAEMTRQYWRFWNQTAEELCSDRAYNEWGKRDLKLYIDAAWIIHKTYLQEVTERHLAEGINDLLEKHGYPEISQKIKNLDQTITSSLSQVNCCFC